MSTCACIQFLADVARPDLFPQLCSIRGDISDVLKGLQPEFSFTGRKYYSIEFEVILSFGLTELKAQLSWKDPKV